MSSRCKDGLLEGLLPTAKLPQRCSAQSPDDIEATLRLPLPPQPDMWAAVHEVFEEPPSPFPQSSLRDTTVNLTNSILGAGMLALPRAFAGLGVAGGLVLIPLVGVMTHASIALMLRPTERSGRLTYASVMEHVWGRRAGAAVRFSIIVGSAGYLVLYLIVLADLLVGSEQYSGIVPDLWPQLPSPLPWYLGRTAMLTWVTLLVAPALVPTTLGGVAPISALKITCTFLCVAALLTLCLALAIQGRLPAVRWLPDPGIFGEGAWVQLAGLVATVPVFMSAFICHMSIHPCVQDLRDYTPARMRSSVAWSIAVAGAIYAAMGGAGFVVFGQGVRGDVLSNLQIDWVADALCCSVPMAMAFVATVKGAMALSMVLSWPITLWPMRQDIIEMLGEHWGATQLSTAGYYALTYGSLLAIYALAISIQSAYRVVGLVGSTLGTAMAFIFPGMLALRDAEGGRPFRAFGWVLVAAGALLTAVGVLSTDEG